MLLLVVWYCTNVVRFPFQSLYRAHLWIYRGLLQMCRVLWLKYRVLLRMYRDHLWIYRPLL